MLNLICGNQYLWGMKNEVDEQPSASKMESSFESCDSSSVSDTSTSSSFAFPLWVQTDLTTLITHSNTYTCMPRNYNIYIVCTSSYIVYIQGGNGVDRKPPSYAQGTETGRLQTLLYILSLALHICMWILISHSISKWGIKLTSQRFIAP